MQKEISKKSLFFFIRFVCQVGMYTNNTASYMNLYVLKFHIDSTDSQ